jgi:hypothetical protein
VDNGEATSWLSVDETRRRLGLSRDAVYKRIKRGSLESRRGNDGAVRVLVTSTTPSVAVLDLSTDTSTPAVGQAADTPLVVRLLAQLEEAREGQEHWRDTAETARLEAATMRAERDAAREQAARAEGALTREQARADRLEAELALARRGWLERVIEALRRGRP